MATYTRAQFVRAVLIEIGVLDANESPQAADNTLADQRTQQAFEAMYDDGLIRFDLDGAIPARYFLPLVQVVARELAMPYGKPVEKFEANAARAMRQIRRLNQAEYVSAPTAATFY
jgi:hypothetical protein